MKPLEQVIVEHNTKIKPVWFMRQAGRYLPEFREIRSKNKDFIKLCLNSELVLEITLQPLERFNIDAAIIFSDILMIPYALDQSVQFKKDFGPILGNLDSVKNNNLSEEKFIKKLTNVYKGMSKISTKLKNKNKSLIGFVGAPWTLIIYMINKQSPKKDLSNDLNDNKIKDDLLKIILNYTKIHIREQVKNGAELIQIFDSWAGLASSKNIKRYIYESTAELVEFTKSLGIPAICFPREIQNYKEYVNEVKPSVINIDYNVNIKEVLSHIQIPIQGGLDPKFLLSDQNTLKNESLKILDILRDHPYIFNLGHGVLPQTDPNMLEYLVNLVKEY